MAPCTLVELMEAWKWENFQKEMYLLIVNLQFLHLILVIVVIILWSIYLIFQYLSNS